MSSEIPPLNPYEAPRAEAGAAGGAGSSPSTKLTVADWLLAILCSGIGCILGVVWMIQGKPKGGKMLGVSILAAVLWNIVRFAIEASMRNQ